MAASSARAASPKWWTNIGAPKFVAAPMVDQSGLAFRLLARKYGAELAFTPMIHAGVSQCPQRGRGYLARHFQTGDGDWPLVAQFAGADEDEVSRSAERVLERDPTNNVVALDLNLGCPQQIARKGRYGAFLLEDDVDAAAKVVARLRKDYCDGTGRVVTCKVRLMPDDGPALRGTKERVARLVDAGASAITVHGRTRLQNKQRSGACDWSAVAALRASLPADVVAIANGGIGCRGDVDRILDATGCDAAMSSEGLLENPALFQGRTRERNSQLQSLISRPYSTRFG
jgi:tRNA-dihydrouridine synthase